MKAKLINLTSPLATCLACALVLCITPVCSQSPLPSTSMTPSGQISASTGGPPAAAVSTSASVVRLAEYLPLMRTIEATTTFALPANNYEIGDTKQFLEVPKLTKVSCRASYKRSSQSLVPDLSLELKTSEAIYLRVGPSRVRLDGALLSNDKITISGGFNSLVARLFDNTAAPSLVGSTKLSKDSIQDICIESLVAETVKDCKGKFSDFDFSIPNGATFIVSKCQVSFAKTMDGEVNISVPGLSLKDQLGRTIDLDGLSGNFQIGAKPDGENLRITAGELTGRFLRIAKLRTKGPEGKAGIISVDVPRATVAMSLSPGNKIVKTDIKSSVNLNSLIISPGADEKLILETKSALKTDVHYTNDGDAHVLEIQTPIKLAELSLRVKNGASSIKCTTSNNVIPSCIVRLSQDIKVQLPKGVHLEPQLNDENATLFNDVPGKVDLKSPVKIVVDSNSKVTCSNTDAHIDFPIVCFKSKESTKKFKTVVGDIHVKDVRDDKIRLFLKASLGDFEDSNRKILAYKSVPTFFSGDIETSLNTPGNIECIVDNGAVQIPFVILNRFITAYLPHNIEPSFSVPFADLRSVSKLDVNAKNAERLELACGLSSTVKILLAAYDMEHFGVLSCKLRFNAPEQKIGVSSLQGIKFKPRLINGKVPNFLDKLANKAANIIVKLVSGFFDEEFELKEITQNIDGIKDIQFQEFKHSERDIVGLFKGRFAFCKPTN